MAKELIISANVHEKKWRCWKTAWSPSFTRSADENPGVVGKPLQRPGDEMCRECSRRSLISH
jgi:hypothetical protein